MADGKVDYEDLFSKELIANIKKLQVESKELFEIYKNAAITLSKYKVATKDAASSSKVLAQEEKKQAAAEIKLQKAKEKLTVQYQRELRAQRESIKEIKQLDVITSKLAGTEEKAAARVKFLTDARKKLDKSTELGRKKAEAYTRAINKQNGILKKNQSLEEKRTSNIGKYGNQLGMMPGKLGAVASSATALGSAFKVMLGPLGLVVGAVGALIGVIKLLGTTDTGATNIASSWQFVKDAFNEARLSALAYFNDTDSASKRSMRQIADDAIVYTEALDRLADRQVQHLAFAAKQRQQSTAMEAIAQDQTKSIEERTEALKKFLALEEKEAKFKTTEARARLVEETSHIAKSYGLKQDQIEFFLMLDADSAERVMRRDKSLRDFRNNLGDEGYKSAVELAAKVFEAETQFNAMKKRAISRLSGFELQLQKDKEAKDVDAYNKTIARLIEESKAYNKKLENQQRVEEEQALLTIEAQEKIKAEYEKVNKVLEQRQKLINDLKLIQEDEVDELFTDGTGEDKERLEKEQKAKALESANIEAQRQESIKSAYQQGRDAVLSIAEKHYADMKALADQNVSDAESEVDRKKTLLDKAKDLDSRGRAFNILSAEKELADAQRIQKKREEEQRKALIKQQFIQSIQQGSNLITASSQIIESSGGLPFVYIPLLLTMWGAFGAAKLNAAKATKYADGGIFEVGGGTHASGNDTSLGVHGGKERKVQRGEKVAVINDRATSFYGSDLDGIIKDINNKALDLGGPSSNSSTIINMNTGKLENGIGQLVKQGKNRTFIQDGRTVVISGNITKYYN